MFSKINVMRLLRQTLVLLNFVPYEATILCYLGIFHSELKQKKKTQSKPKHIPCPVGPGLLRSPISFLLPLFSQQSPPVCCPAMPHPLEQVSLHQRGPTPTFLCPCIWSKTAPHAQWGPRQWGGGARWAAAMAGPSPVPGRRASCTDGQRQWAKV